MRTRSYHSVFVALAVVCAGTPQAWAGTSPPGPLDVQHKPGAQESVQAVYRQQNALFKAGQWILQPGVSYAYSVNNRPTRLEADGLVR